MMNYDELSFGDRCAITEKYKRITKYIDNVHWKIWKQELFNAENCLFLGFRYLQNGIVKWDYDDQPTLVFKPQEFFKAALVCPKGRSPIYVPLDSIKSEPAV